MSGAHDFPASSQGVAGVFGLAWVLKRTALGLVILMVTVSTAAWLLYAGIEPDRADASPQVVHEAQAVTTGTLPNPRPR